MAAEKVPEPWIKRRGKGGVGGNSLSYHQPISKISEQAKSSSLDHYFAYKLYLIRFLYSDPLKTVQFVLGHS